MFFKFAPLKSLRTKFGASAYVTCRSQIAFVMSSGARALLAHEGIYTAIMKVCPNFHGRNQGLRERESKLSFYVFIIFFTLTSLCVETFPNKDNHIINSRMDIQIPLRKP